MCEEEEEREGGYPARAFVMHLERTVLLNRKRMGVRARIIATLSLADKFQLLFRKENCHERTAR